MQNNRAKLFNPFDALKGLQESLRLQEKITEEKLELSTDLEDILNKKILTIKKGDNITIKYYNDLEYIETSGIVKKIDEVEKYIYILSTKISFEDIINIDLISL